MKTAARSPSASGSTAGTWRRMAPATRWPSNGSVSTRTPSSSTRTVEWPRNVSRSPTLHPPTPTLLRGIADPPESAGAGRSDSSSAGTRRLGAERRREEDENQDHGDRDEDEDAQRCRHDRHELRASVPETRSTGRRLGGNRATSLGTVSYTHLTLPTIY